MQFCKRKWHSPLQICYYSSVQLCHVHETIAAVMHFCYAILRMYYEQVSNPHKN